MVVLSLKCVSRTSKSVLGVILALFLVPSAFAEPLKVYRDQYIIEPSISATGAARALSSVGVKTIRSVGSGGATLVSPATSAARISGASEVVDLDPNDTVCISLLKTGAVKSCSPNYQVKATATSPNDPQFSSTWGMSESGIDAPSAWDITRGSASVIVAIIDTGVDYTHPDLAANIWTNSGEIPNNGIDDDHNGYVDDIHGMNAINHSGNPMDDNLHGTHVAGTIGAVGNNSVGVAGVNWSVKMMALKFLDSEGSGSLSDAIEAIDYMVLMKNRGVDIKVVNNSWGGGGYSAALHNAIIRAKDAGIIFTAAAGNESNDNDANPSYPASYDVNNVVSVAAIDSNQNVAGFSNYGASSVDIAAPGVSILSTSPGNSYRTLSGTSMATPHVTGALALLLSNEPWLPYEQAINRVYDSGLEVSSLTGVVRTGRKVSVSRMIHNLTAPITPPAPPPTCNYSMSSTVYSPDTSADAEPVVIQADEANFYALSLPFIFPFHGQSVSTIYISPNGVVYTQRAPTSMDYQNSAKAPTNSIAALHSDLVADRDPQGVRVAADSTHATIYWKMKHYSRRSGADAEVRLTLYSDGRIEDSFAFGDSLTETAVRSQSTVGLAGSTTASSYTYAYNSSLIANRTAVLFTPNCGDSSSGVAIASLKIKGYKNRKPTSRLVPGQSVRVSLSGTGAGNVTLQAAFNRRVCTNTKLTAFNSGAVLNGKLPKVPAGITSLTLTALGAKGEARFDQSSAARRSARRVSKISTKRFDNYCATLLNSLEN